MFWKIVFSIVALIVGQLSGAYTVIMPLCCLRMGIPFANCIQKSTGIDMSIVKKRYWFSLILWLIIDAILLAVLLLFIPELYAIIFGLGTGFALLINFRQTGLNENNLSDFVSFAASSLSENEQARVSEYIESMM